MEHGMEQGMEQGACSPAGTAARERRTGRDAGHTTVEVIGWTSAMIAGLSILVQALAAGLATLACQAAAGHALQATRIAGGTPQAGLSDARQVLHQVAGRLIADPALDVTRVPGATSTVTVSGTALAVIPLIRIPLSATASGPTEPELAQP